MSKIAETILWFLLGILCLVAALALMGPETPPMEQLRKPITESPAVNFFLAVLAVVILAIRLTRKD